MNISISLKYIICTSLLLSVFDPQPICASNESTATSENSFLSEFTAKHPNTLYDEKQFTFYANPSFLYLILTGSASICGILGTLGIKKVVKEIPPMYISDVLFMLSTGAVIGIAGIIGTGLFLDAVKMKYIQKVEYLKFNDLGIYKWGQLQAKWENISAIYLSKTYYGDSKTRNASFSDANLNDLFEITDRDLFLPVSFDDFLSISQYYLNKTKTTSPQS